MGMEPTPEQFAEWLSIAMDGKPMEYMHGKPGALAGDIARLAYAAGADAELQACCEWLEMMRYHPGAAEPLRAARRPKPSRKYQAAEQLLALLDEMKRHGLDVPAHDTLSAVIADSPDE